MTGQPPARWSPSLLLLGGAVAVVFAALFAVEAIVDTTLPTGLAAGVAFTLAFVGLLGVVPVLTTHQPWVARLGGLSVGLGAVGFAALVVTEAATLAGAMPAPAPPWLELLNLPRIVGLIPGFLLVGVAWLRSDLTPRAVGGFLLVPAIAFTLNLVAVATVGGGDVSPWIAAAITLGEAVGLLGAGYHLRRAVQTGSPPSRETGAEGVVPNDW